MESASGLSLRDPVTAQTTLAGVPCKHRQWRTDDVRVDAFFLLRKRMFFGLWVVDEDGTLTSEKAKRTFSLLD